MRSYGPLAVAACLAGSVAAMAAPLSPAPLPSAVAASLRASGLPLKSFGVMVRPRDGRAAVPIASLNAEQPFLMASTAKVVTSMAAMRLLGPDHAWRSRAVATGPVVDGRLAGDLVIGGPDAGLTPADLRRWFAQMRVEGLKEVSGRIVLDQVALLQDPPALTTAAEGGGAEPSVPASQRLVVTVQPGAGSRAEVSLRPRPAGVQVINDVAMGGDCTVYARWKTTLGGGPAATSVWVSGRWDRRCGRQDAATLALPQGLPGWAPTAAGVASTASTVATVADLWRETGGRLRGRVVQASGPPTAAPSPAWSSQHSTTLAERLREINKASLNIGANRLLLALAGSGSGDPLQRARGRVQDWLRQEGLAADDLHIELGSGQSRSERGKPRALVQLLHNAWTRGDAAALIGSLPVAGIDGTLSHRLKQGSATGRAFLKTGTLSDTRALAGYVMGRSGRVYAVAALVNHPQAARATPALDALVEWVAQNG